jgi:Methyltransferase domain
MGSERVGIAGRFAHLHENYHGATLHPSDWCDKAPDDPIFGVYRKCGFLNKAEADVLEAWAAEVTGRWLDIGAHTGWSALHMLQGGAEHVTAVDPAYDIPEFRRRTHENIRGCGSDITLVACTSREFFAEGPDEIVTGVLIDASHDWGEPLHDAVKALDWLDERCGVILLHDFIGGPVREAVRYLMLKGMSCRVYYLSSQLLAACWFSMKPPERPAPLIALQEQMPDFDFSKCV